MAVNLSTVDFDAKILSATLTASVISGSNTANTFVISSPSNLPIMSCTISGVNSYGSDNISELKMREAPSVGCPPMNIGFGFGTSSYVTGSPFNTWTTGGLFPDNPHPGTSQIFMYTTRSDGTPVYAINMYQFGVNSPTICYTGDLDFTTASFLFSATHPPLATLWCQFDDGKIMRVGGTSWSGQPGIDTSNCALSHSFVIDVNGTGSMTFAGFMQDRRISTQGPANLGYLIPAGPGRVVAVGGMGKSGSLEDLGSSARLSGVEIWCTGVWSPLADMVPTREGHSSFYIGNNKIVVYGGYTGSGNYDLYEPLGYTTVLDVAANTWTEHTQTLSASLRPMDYWLTSGNTVKWAVITTGSASGKVFMFGGANTGTQLLDTGTMQWSVGPPMNYPKIDTTSVMTADGKIVAFGKGTQYNDPALSIEWIDPAGEFVWHECMDMSARSLRLCAFPMHTGTKIAALEAGEGFGPFGGNFNYFSTNLTGAYKYVPEITSYSWTRGGAGATLAFTGTNLDVVSAVFGHVTNSSFGFKSDAGGTAMNVTVPGLAAVGETVSLYVKNSWGQRPCSAFRYSGRTTGSFDPATMQIGGEHEVSESLKSISTWTEGDYSERGQCEFNKTIIRGGGFDFNFTGTLVDDSYPILSASGGNKFQNEYTNWVEQWSDEGMTPRHLAKMKTGCCDPTFIQIDANRIASIGGGTDRELYWSGSNAGDVYWSSRLSGPYYDRNWEPMYHRGEDPANKFYNVQILDLTTGTGSWSNAANQLNVPRMRPTVIPLTTGTYSGSFFVVGGYGESILGYQLDTIFMYLNTGVAIYHPRLRSAEVGHPDTGWTLRSDMPSSSFEQYAITGPTLPDVTEGWYIKSGTTAELIAQSNGCLPVSYSHGRVDMSAVQLNDGRVFIVGGEQYYASETGSALLYDLDADTWEEMKFPVSTLGTTSDVGRSFGKNPSIAKMLDGRVFIYGQAYGSMLWPVQIFDPLQTGNDRWIKVADQYAAPNLPNARAHIMENGNIAVYAPGRAVSAGYVYDQCDGLLHTMTAYHENSNLESFIGGFGVYMGSGSFFSVFSDWTSGEGTVIDGTKSQRIYQDLSSSLTSTLISKV